jgi:hypothetical protein
LVALADDNSEGTFEWIPPIARGCDDRDYGDEDTEDLRARAAMWTAVIHGDKASPNATFMSWEYEYHDDDDSDSASVVSNDSSFQSVVSNSQGSESSHVSFEDDDVDTLMEMMQEELEDLACMVLDGEVPASDTPEFTSSEFFAMAEAQMRQDTD